MGLQQSAEAVVVACTGYEGPNKLKLDTPFSNGWRSSREPGNRSSFLKVGGGTVQARKRAASTYGGGRECQEARNDAHRASRAQE